MSLLLLTLASAISSAYLLFKIYNIGQALVLKKLDWRLEELKNYTVTTTVKKWNNVIEAVAILAIFWKVFYT